MCVSVRYIAIYIPYIHHDCAVFLQIIDNRLCKCLHYLYLQGTRYQVPVPVPVPGTSKINILRRPSMVSIILPYSLLVLNTRAVLRVDFERARAAHRYARCMVQTPRRNMRNRRRTARRHSAEHHSFRWASSLMVFSTDPSLAPPAVW